MFSRDHHMSGGPSRLRGATMTRFVAPLAVIALLAITAWLEFDSRAAAQGAVRDYAAVASSRYSQHIATLLKSHLVASTRPVRDLRLSPGDTLPHPRVLSERASQCDCGAVGVCDEHCLHLRIKLGTEPQEREKPIIHGGNVAPQVDEAISFRVNLLFKLVLRKSIKKRVDPIHVEPPRAKGRVDHTLL